MISIEEYKKKKMQQLDDAHEVTHKKLDDDLREVAFKLHNGAETKEDGEKIFDDLMNMIKASNDIDDQLRKEGHDIPSTAEVFSKAYEDMMKQKVVKIYDDGPTLDELFGFADKPQE